jgi:CRISPR-associated protein Cmr4
LENNTRMYWLQAITPLHIGSGKGIGFIDMPIMREKVTNWPLVPGSAVKGVMRDYFDNLSDEEKVDSALFDATFGKPSDDKDSEDKKGERKKGDDASSAGSLILTDAHIVCLPIRSLYGTFAYVSSQLVLERLKRDLEAAGYRDVPAAPKACDSEALHTSESKLVAECDKIFFEDLDFNASEDKETAEWAEILSSLLFPQDPVWKGIFIERFAIVSDDCFNFLSETGTEVDAHVRIKDDTKIVAKGALWYEEALPSEAIMAGIAWCDRVFGNNEFDEKTILEKFCPISGLDFQIGGKATVGKGRVRCFFTKGQA